MSFLLLTDYNKQITSDNLNQVTDSTPQYRIDAEAAAIAEVRSYLVQRYNVDRAFTDVLLFDITATYNVGDRVQFTAPVWNNSTAYSIGQYVTYSITNTTGVYKALTSNTGVAPG